MIWIRKWLSLAAVVALAATFLAVCGCGYG